MSYNPTTWKDGDLVTSTKLNKLEQGAANISSISSAGEILVTTMDSSGYLDKTWQELYDADVCVLKYLDLSTLGNQLPLVMKPILNVFVNDTNQYKVGPLTFGTSAPFEAASPDEYPKWSMG